MRACNGDREKAVHESIRMFSNDHDLYKALMDPLLEITIKRLVDSWVRDKRRSIADTIINNKVDRPAFRRDSAMEVIATTTSVFDWPMPGNKTLGECTRNDLLAAAAKQRLSVKTMMCNIRWYEMIAEKLKSESAFASILGEQVVSDLLKKAESEA